MKPPIAITGWPLASWYPAAEFEFTVAATHEYRPAFASSSLVTAGLELLAKHGRLDCAYEQIILDFPGEFDAGLIAKARENLARAPRTVVPCISRRLHPLAMAGLNHLSDQGGALQADLPLGSEWQPAWEIFPRPARV